MKRSGPIPRARFRESKHGRQRRVTAAELTRMCRKLVVEVRDGNQCQRCGAPASRSKIDWAHVKNRGAKSLVYVPWASLALCVGCHFWFDGNKEASRRWWNEQWPDRAILLGTWERSRSRPKFDPLTTWLWLDQKLRNLV